MHSTARNNPLSVPAELCGYPVERALTGDQSYLAIGPGGRAVVLKRVDEDCLLGNQLHPSIKERLARVRELAHGGVANLHGVSRDDDAAWLIWEYVDGLTFEQYLSDSRRTPLELLNIGRELLLAVESLHSQGIVHGALVGSNVIITSEGEVRLTHISPLLYTDIQVDVESVVSILREAVEYRRGQDSALGRILEDAGRESLSLRGLATKIAAFLEVRSDVSVPERQEDRHIRRRTFLAAGIVGLLGLVLAYGIWRVTEGTAEFHSARWLIPSSTPDK
jgi:hypothetical protein